MSLTKRVLTGLGAGVAVGLLLGDYAAVFKLPGMLPIVLLMLPIVTHTDADVVDRGRGRPVGVHGRVNEDVSNR